MVKRIRLIKKYNEPKTQEIPHRLYATPNDVVSIRERPFLAAKITGSLEKCVEIECETEMKEHDEYLYAEISGHRGWFVVRYGNIKYCSIRKEYEIKENKHDA